MKNYYHSILAYAFLTITFQMHPCLSTNLATDQTTLLIVRKRITSDPSHLLTRNWTNSSSVCSWIGVTCSSRHQRVAALNLSHMSLSGTIPPQLGRLSFLVSLDLTSSLFTGALPHELSLLHRLKFMSLRNNSFTGSIPKSLSNLTNLQTLDLSSNSLSGEIPKELGRLRSLQSLWIESNHLSGAIPSAIFNMSKLVTISLRDNELSGSLPADMCGNIPFLDEINLSINQLSGEIPTNLSRCSRLQTLGLSYNSFSGQIPSEIGYLTSLQALALGGNNLNGILPHEIVNLHSLVGFGVENNKIGGSVDFDIFKNMSSLQILYLWRNKFTGSLSRDVGNLTMLMELDLSYNNFTGVIPREIGQHLHQLEILRLGMNMLSGSVPPEIFNISTLTSLSLTQNGMSGALPSNFCSGFPLIEELYLGMNHLRGQIPESISNCSRLKDLDLSLNKFTGLVPHSLGTLTFLEILNLHGNNLTIGTWSSELSFITSLANCRSLNFLGISGNPLDGTLPSSIGNLSSQLEIFSAFEAGLKGGIPAEIGNLTKLVRLRLDGNHLSGNIPNTVKHLGKLQGLYIHKNNIKGSILDDLCDIYSLSDLGLSENHLSGAIPECLGNMTSLRQLYLDSNMLTSTIPPGLWRLNDLMALDLSANSLTGFLPPEVGNLVATIYINLSMNQLSESIPSTIGSLQNLVNLSLAYNRFEGLIPVSIGSMVGLEILDLSYNNLSGSVPKSLQKLLNLDNLNISFNDLSGEIPSGGPFLNFTMESFKGNQALCGIPRFGVPPCRVVSTHRSKTKKVEFALFILAGVVTFTTILCLGFIFLVRYRRKDRATSGTGGILSVVPERISYYELSRATQRFNESNLLGMGGFSSVYKGILEDGRVIAVKVFKLQFEAALRSFDAECEVLRNIRHRNLTKVISSCSNEKFKALVLEYMPNGNLENWLYSHNNFLDFIQRLNIMIEVASALDYLHHGYSTPIVHCDLKPSNVLLDEEMVAHVSDFSVSKLLGEGESVVITNTLATLGYIAPEYGLEGLVSTRCDVYSYGVLLMETFTRKKPSDYMFGGDISLRVWVERAVPQSTYQVIDVNLLMNVDEEHGDKIVELTCSIFELAFKCSAKYPNDRINMKEALAELHKIKGRCLVC